MCDNAQSQQRIRRRVQRRRAGFVRRATLHLPRNGLKMERPRRTRGDELLEPGELTRVRERLRIRAQEHDLTSVIACAFDHRTRMLPFIFADTRMIPAGGRATSRTPARNGDTVTGEFGQSPRDSGAVCC